MPWTTACREYGFDCGQKLGWTGDERGGPVKELVGLLVSGLVAYIVARWLVPTQAGANADRGVSGRFRAEWGIWLSSGVAAILLGILLGPLVSGTFSRSIIEDLSPLEEMLAGWVGWLIGLQMNWDNLRRIETKTILWTGGEVLVASTLVTGAVALAMLVWLGRVFWPAAVIFGALAGVSSPMIVALSAPRARSDPFLRRLFVHTSLAPAFSVLILGTVLACLPLGRGRWGAFGAWFWILMGPAVGLLLGGLFHFLTLYRIRDKDLLVVMLGFVALGSGAARVMGLSPLLVTMLAGMVVAGRSPQRRRLFVSLQRAEKPFFLFLLVVAGSLWLPLSGVGPWVAVLAAFWGRGVAKTATGLVLYVWCDGRRGARSAFPLALVGHGGVVVAMAVTVHDAMGGTVGQMMLTYALIGVLLSPGLVPFLRDAVRSEEQGDRIRDGAGQDVPIQSRRS